MRTFPATSYSSTCLRCLVAVFDVNCCLQLLAPAAPIWSIVFLLFSMLLPLYGSVTATDAVGVAVAEDVDDVVNESMLDTLA